MTEVKTLLGKYMYCIVRSPGPRKFTSQGIGGGGDIVHTVRSNSLTAVVSDSPIVEYERSRRYMMAHTLVQEEVMQECTILPVRFGTVGPSAEAIQEQVLDRRCGELNSLL